MSLSSFLICGKNIITDLQQLSKNCSHSPFDQSILSELSQEDFFCRLLFDLINEQQDVDIIVRDLLYQTVESYWYHSLYYNFKYNGDFYYDIVLKDSKIYRAYEEYNLLFKDTLFDINIQTKKCIDDQINIQLQHEGVIRWYLSTVDLDSYIESIAEQMLNIMKNHNINTFTVQYDDECELTEYMEREFVPNLKTLTNGKICSYRVKES